MKPVDAKKREQLLETLKVMSTVGLDVFCTETEGFNPDDEWVTHDLLQAEQDYQQAKQALLEEIADLAHAYQITEDDIEDLDESEYEEFYIPENLEDLDEEE